MINYARLRAVYDRCHPFALLFGKRYLVDPATISLN